MALAVAALICIFISVRLATSSETIAFDRGIAGPWAAAWFAPATSIVSPRTRTAHSRTLILFVMFVSMRDAGICDFHAGAEAPALRSI